MVIQGDLYMHLHMHMGWGGPICLASVSSMQEELTSASVAAPVEGRRDLRDW